MFSTFSTCVLPSSDPILGNPFSAFDGGFTPWDSSDLDLQYFIDSPQNVISYSGSVGDFLNKPESGSDFNNQNMDHVDKKVRYDEPNQPVSVIDEGKERRMKSNRESARRSRTRKKNHLENLRNQVNRLKIENRELSNSFRYILHHFQRVRTDNDRLRSEFSVLHSKLSDIRQIMLFWRLQQQFQPATSTSWPCTAIISEQTPSLFTNNNKNL